MNIFPNKGRPLSLWIMTAVTLLYLLIEFSFNSRLLDAVGGISSETSIEKIEWWGRSLSGFAVALLIWPLILGRAMSWFARFSLILVLTLTVMAVVFFGEKSLVDSIVENSTPTQRYAASNLMLLQNALVTNDAQIDGLDLNREQLTAPDGKAFLATFPLMLMAVKDIDQKIKDQKTILIRRMIDERYGGLAVNFNRYRESIKQLEKSYNDYVDGTNSYSQSLANTARQQNDGWARYEAKLSRRGMTPYSVPRMFYRRVRRDVVNSGVRVPSDWVPSDRAGFNRAIARRVKSETDSRYRDGIIRSAGFYIPPGLHPNEFLNNSSVQKKWRDMLKYPEGIHLASGYGNPQEFERAVYSNVLDINVRQQLAKLDAPPSDFDDGEKYEGFGKANMSALIAPPMALAFSVLGAVVHVFKTLFFLIQCVTGRTWANFLIKYTAILASVTMMFWIFSTQLESRITSQDIYKNYLYSNVISMPTGNPGLVGYVIANAIRGTIHIQPIAYPVFEFIRLNLLGGFKFGYKG